MNNKLYYEDIICAKATPSGSSAIAVIRVSGKNCFSILDKIFIPKRKEYKSHRVYYGNIVENGEIIDNVLVLTFHENKSFTGEESFEIHSHGSEVIVSIILKLLINCGCRLAEPGEFSKRAFLNGKIDLSEAEAIMDIVNASTKKSAFIAAMQLTGVLKKEINIIKDQISDLLASIEVYIDYPEEDLSVDIEKWLIELNKINQKIEKLIKGYNRGRYYRNGIKAVLLGKTNSGKSTLFNYLLNEDKAIVSDIHGTTRDYIDALINIEGYGVRLYDTAGLRDTVDPIEIEGTKRSKELASKCDILLYVIDGSEGITIDDKKNLSELCNSKKIIIIINKIDKIKDIQLIQNEIYQFLINLLDIENFKIVKMSGLNKDGIEDFNKNFIELMINEKNIDSDLTLITNERHYNLLELSHINIINSMNSLKENILDIACFELRESLDRIGEITGTVTREDIINKIFSNFCVGK